ncbi:hypothetical protein [Aureimonas psammosilenae]|uniref:hypothetical protein n=1 Tax=Aureimonas psammosilenae TaxID=2495496 RepID=UPI0012612DE3|nr:hypothetical protein [Aureimonas psammosilenae]
MSEHGGARTGAGRPAGAINKRTQAQAEAVEATGISPLDYLLSVMRNAENDDDTRIEAAKAAAPYVHAKLASVEVSGKLTISHEDALAALE